MFRRSPVLAARVHANASSTPKKCVRKYDELQARRRHAGRTAAFELVKPLLRNTESAASRAMDLAFKGRHSDTRYKVHKAVEDLLERSSLLLLVHNDRKDELKMMKKLADTIGDTYLQPLSPQECHKMFPIRGTHARSSWAALPPSAKAQYVQMSEDRTCAAIDCTKDTLGLREAAELLAVPPDAGGTAQLREHVLTALGSVASRVPTEPVKKDRKTVARR